MDLRLGCTDFPRPQIVVSPPTVNRIELLEVDGNITQLAVNVTGAQNMTSSDTLVSAPYNLTTSP